MKFSNLETQNKILLISFVVFFGLYVLLNYRQKPKEVAQDLQSKVETADTYIPAGHVLVPIEIENYESVSGIIGAFALVDLYTRSTATESNELVLVAQKIKLIRAPLNPSQYAVLVTEAESVELLKTKPNFLVTIHNQKSIANPNKSFGITKLDKQNNTKTVAHLQESKRSDLNRKVKIRKLRAQQEVDIEYYESKKARYL